jgi:Asp-tRNA(Asn)/Glu-tRNA(Gln) amidotransferase A subunit family amidase
VGAAITTGMGLIGIATDTDGSTVNLAAANGMYGLRPPREEMEKLMAGVVPQVEVRDTVGMFN